MLSVKSVLPITTVVLAVLAIWYAFAVWMNAPLQRDAYANAGRADYSAQDLIVASLNMERPKLPGPHQVAGEMYRLIVATPPTSKRSLVYHGADHARGDADRLPDRRRRSASALPSSSCRRAGSTAR